jgi:ubiquitin-conjugating enzyme E2 A
MVDLKNLRKSKITGIDAEPKPESMLTWTAWLSGPANTAWEGGVYVLSLTFKESYPLTPPDVLFLTPIFHPNVYHDGRICVDILGSKWTPTNDVLSILVSLQILLVTPNPNSPANPEAGHMLLSNPSAYDERVREMARMSVVNPKV